MKSQKIIGVLYIIAQYPMGLKQLNAKGKEQIEKCRKSGEEQSVSWRTVYYRHLSNLTFLLCNFHFSLSVQNSTEFWADTVILIRGRHNVIPRDFAERFAEAAKFRNILVHMYAEVDWEMVYGILQNNLGDFDEFAKYIARYLTKVEAWIMKR